MDVWGPASTLSSNGSRYFLSILDDYSKYMWLFPLQLKSNVSSIVMALLKYVETQFFTKLMSIQTDNGGEFRALWPIFCNLGITNRLTCPYSHPQNGSIE